MFSENGKQYRYLLNFLAKFAEILDISETEEIIQHSTHFVKSLLNLYPEREKAGESASSDFSNEQAQRRGGRKRGSLQPPRGAGAAGAPGDHVGAGDPPGLFILGSNQGVQVILSKV